MGFAPVTAGAAAFSAGFWVSAMSFFLLKMQENPFSAKGYLARPALAQAIPAATAPPGINLSGKWPD
jgi:hypothetical protein